MTTEEQEAANKETKKAFADTVNALEGALKAAEVAEAKVAQLTLELARKEQIILEKVAAEKSAAALPKVTSTEVQDLVNTLVVAGQLPQDKAASLQKHLLEHPDNIVKLASKLSANITQISMPAPSFGKGIAKEASVGENSEADPDGWRTMLTEGA